MEFPFLTGHKERNMSEIFEAIRLAQRVVRNIVDVYEDEVEGFASIKSYQFLVIAADALSGFTTENDGAVQLEDTSELKKNLEKLKASQKAATDSQNLTPARLRQLEKMMSEQSDQLMTLCKLVESYFDSTQEIEDSDRFFGTYQEVKELSDQFEAMSKAISVIRGKSALADITVEGS